MADTKQLIGGWITIDGYGWTAYGFPFGGNHIQYGNATNGSGIVSTPGTIKNLRLKLTAIPPSGQHAHLTLYKNGVATALTITINDTDITGSDLVNEVSVVAGDRLTLYAQAPTSKAPSFAYVYDFIPTTPGETLLMSAGCNPAINQFCPVIAGFAQATEFDVQILIPCSGTIKYFYVRTISAPGSGKTSTFTVRKNGVNTTLIVSLVGTQTTNNNIVDNFTVAAGDKLSIQLTGDSLSNYTSFGLCFVPDTIGNFIISRKCGTTALRNTVTDYHTIESCDTVYSPSEGVQQIFSECILKNLYVELDRAPDNGAGTQSWTFTLRKNAASQGLTVIISELNTIGNCTTDVSVADNDFINNLITPAGTPATDTGALISYTGYIPPPPVIKTILSDAKIKTTGIQEDILSDAKVVDQYQKTILSDAIIKITNIQKTILSDSKIKSINNQKNITSDASIISSKRKDILSDAKIKTTGIQEDILSDAKIIVRNQETILSDSKILVLGVQKTILSDAKIAIQVLVDFINKINFVQQVLSNVNNKVNTVIRVLSDVNNFINTCKSIISDVVNDFRTQKLTLNNLTNDIRFMQSWQKSVTGVLQSLGKEYIKVYIGGAEQTDVDVDSINISKDLDSSHTASFDLGRAYDASKPAMEATVSIKYNNWILFSGYITGIAPADSPEKIRINCQNEYWKQNKSNVYYHIGHKPTDDKELYYETLALALNTEHGWNLGIGNFTPETMDNFAVGKSDAITNLIQEMGNYGWFYDVDGSKKLWTAGDGSVIELKRQTLGENINLYDVINHSFDESVENLVNKFRVQMGSKVIRKFDSTGGSRTYTGYNYSSFQGFLIPAWGSSYEKTASYYTGNDYGWNYPEPGYEKEYGEVFKKFYIPYLDPTISSWSDRFPPRIEIHSPGGYYYSAIGEITEGFSIDYENRIITFNQPQLLWKTDSSGELIAARAALLKLFLWKKNYYTFTEDPTDNPETDVSNPLMFFTDKMGIYPDTIIKDLNLSNLSIQIGGSYVDAEGVTQVIPSWDDTAFAHDIANWKLSKSCDKQIKGTINITLDAMCFYSIDLSKRIFIAGITDEPMNITSINYNIGSFTVSLTLENSRYFNRTTSFQSHGE